jgi:hypothetical protein
MPTVLPGAWRLNCLFRLPARCRRLLLARAGLGLGGAEGVGDAAFGGIGLLVDTVRSTPLRRPSAGGCRPGGLEDPLVCGGAVPLDVLRSSFTSSGGMGVVHVSWPARFFSPRSRRATPWPVQTLPAREAKAAAARTMLSCKDHLTFTIARCDLLREAGKQGPPAR